LICTAEFHKNQKKSNPGKPNACKGKNEVVPQIKKQKAFHVDPFWLFYSG